MSEKVPQSFGKYEIIEEIGGGGFGTVYRARDTELDRLVALKILRPEHLDNLTFVERFRREARAAANLEHPNIVTIYEVGEVEGRHYIAMRLLEGQSLGELLAERGKPLPPEEVLSILTDVASALDYAHSKGMIHRDVKPSNIFVTSDSAVLADFGIVRVMSDATRMTTMGQSMGTPEYMAPEQILGREVNAQTDVYALGIVTYELFTGRVPYSGPTPFAIQDAHVRAKLTSVSSLNPRLPASADKVLEKALSKRADERYVSASAMVTALRDVLSPAREPVTVLSPAGATSRRREQRTPPVQPVSQVQRPTKGKKRRAIFLWILAASIVGGTLTCVAGGMGGCGILMTLFDEAVVFFGGGTSATAPQVRSTAAPRTVTDPPTQPSGGDSELDYSLEPNYGDEDLEAGFMPDPSEVELISGGIVDVASLDLGSGCTGYATSTPDYRINWTGSTDELRIFFVANDSEYDTTLIVNTASGEWMCNDDSDSLNPMVEIENPQAGQYDIWVGSYSSEEFIAGMLYITELDLGPADYSE